MNEQGKRFVHELTMEYIIQNGLLQHTKDSIPKQIDFIVEIENIIYDCVEKRLNDFKTL